MQNWGVWNKVLFSELFYLNLGKGFSLVVNIQGLERMGRNNACKLFPIADLVSAIFFWQYPVARKLIISSI
jgi:hypothetical protein